MDSIPMHITIDYYYLRLRLRLRTSVWLGRTWGYAPHHPTQNKLKVRELEWPDVGFRLQESYIYSRNRNKID